MKSDDGSDVHQVTFLECVPGDWNGNWRYINIPSAVDGPPSGSNDRSPAGNTQRHVLCVSNPARGQTEVRFETPSETTARLEVMDSAGRLVRTLLLRRLPSGVYSLTWDGRDERGRCAASGVYYIRLETDLRRETAPLALLH